MKKIFAIILSLILLALCACASDESVSDNTSAEGSKSTVSDNVSVSDDKESAADASETVSENSPAASKASGTKTLEKITVEHSVYTFYDYGKGEYFTEFDAVKNDDNGTLTLNLKDGRSVDLVYGEIVYDETEGIYKTEINGLEFWVEDITDGEGRMLQILECIEYPERSIFVHYYPELDCGDMTIVFKYEANGTEYTFNYADGNTSVKTILFDEETEEYYFG